ncbi:MAG: hypothetical protein AAGK37_21925 [Pseudomonadota bacterium]
MQLDPTWHPSTGGLTRAQLKLNRKRSWWSIMAYEYDMVTAPDASQGRNELVAHLLPDIFDRPAQVTKVKDRVFPDELRAFWKGRITPMRVKLPGSKNFVPVWVKTKSTSVAKQRLTSILPKGTSISLPN